MGCHSINFFWQLGSAGTKYVPTVDTNGLCPVWHVSRPASPNPHSHMDNATAAAAATPQRQQQRLTNHNASGVNNATPVVAMSSRL